MNIEEEIKLLQNKIVSLEVSIASTKTVLKNAKDDVKLYKRKIKQLEKLRNQAAEITGA